MSSPRYSPPAGGLTFARFQELTAELTGAERLATFCHDLDPEAQEACWAALRAECDGKPVPILESEPVRRRWRAPTLELGSVVPLRRDHRDDPLLAIPPVVFVERLAGVEVGHRRKIHCPLADHNERSPSFHVYPHPEQGVWCFGCSRGGDIYSFAALLAGIPLPLRGRDFIEVHHALLQEFRL